MATSCESLSDLFGSLCFKSSALEKNGPCFSFHFPRLHSYHPFPLCYHRAMNSPKSQGLQPAFLAFAPVHGGCICPIKTQGDHPINLEGWDGEGGGRDVQVGGGMGKPMADSC